MGLIQFQQLKEKPKPKSMVIKRPIDYDNIEDSIFFCICKHPDYSHYLTVGECHYSPCVCEKFTSTEIEIVVQISIADIFSFENPDLEIDSIYWWEEIGEYIKCNKKFSL